jgi:energy-coupling factor transporter ATP-binding protein EcfA2
MIQLDQLVLFNADGETRTIGLRPGRLNVITGDSGTGKSSLINIIRFLLGSGNPHTPRGPISRSIAWFGLRGHVGDTRFVIARPAPEAGAETNEAMLLIGVDSIPPFDQLQANTSRVALREYLGGLIGLEDNLNVPGEGRTRLPLSATFVHSLYYCFQGQGEIANPDILFHHQNIEWIPQTIRDTLPFFLGAQGVDDLRRRELLTELRRNLRRAQQRLRAAEAEQDAGLDRAASLLTESVDVGLLAERPTLEELAEAQRMLRQLVDAPPPKERPTGFGGEFDRLRRQRVELSDALREIADQLRGLDEFAAVDDAYNGELVEHRARLASIGLITDDASEAPCPVCGRSIGEHEAPSHSSVERALGRAERRLELAQRDRPRVQAARDVLRTQQADLQRQLRDVDQALDALATQDEIASALREAINLQSYVRGRIAQYLDSIEDTGDVEMESLRSEVTSLEAEVAELTEALDPAALRSRTDSLLRTVSRQMTEWAQELELEHAAEGAQIDLDRLTIVADTPDGPAYMDRGEIGSGMNWVGYHLTAYLALQDFFIRHRRPVPSFLVLDQPSQAFFPQDRVTGGDLEELSDTDRENTRKLYKLMYDVVERLDGKLQIVALDHADFGDEWFASSVEHRWRGGEGLIPRAWYENGNRQ